MLENITSSDSSEAHGGLASEHVALTKLCEFIYLLMCSITRQKCTARVRKKLEHDTSLQTAVAKVLFFSFLLRLLRQSLRLS